MQEDRSYLHTVAALHKSDVPDLPVFMECGLWHTSLSKGNWLGKKVSGKSPYISNQSERLSQRKHFFIALYSLKFLGLNGEGVHHIYLTILIFFGTFSCFIFYQLVILQHGRALHIFLEGRIDFLLFWIGNYYSGTVVQL